LIDEQEVTVRQLERYIVAEEKTGVDQTMRLGWCGEGKEVLAVNFLSNRLQKLNEQVEEEHQNAVDWLSKEEEEMLELEEDLKREHEEDPDESWRRSSELMEDMIRATSVSTHPMSVVQMVFRGRERGDEEHESFEEEEEDGRFEDDFNEESSLMRNGSETTSKLDHGEEEDDDDLKKKKKGVEKREWYGDSSDRSYHSSSMLASKGGVGMTTRAFVTFNSFAGFVRLFFLNFFLFFPIIKSVFYFVLNILINSCNYRKTSSSWWEAFFNQRF